jgi:hypothetical protein
MPSRDEGSKVKLASYLVTMIYDYVNYMKAHHKCGSFSVRNVPELQQISSSALKCTGN